MISCKGVTRAWNDGAEGTLTVLNGVDLEVTSGEFLALVGRSGSGKSTLLNILGGLDSDYAGTVSVDGVSLQALKDTALSRFRNTRVGMVFQSFHLVQGLSLVENVALPSRFASASVPSVEDKARQALERVGLGGKTERRPHQLSGGERQRVAIARALFMSPKVLLCDEPTGNLDAQTAEEITGLFRKLNAEGLTIVAVTHEERLKQVCSRVVTLVEGRLQ